MNLMRNIPDSIRNKLTGLVRLDFRESQTKGIIRIADSLYGAFCFSIFLVMPRKFTMPKFINHESLAADLFNLKHSTASGTLQPWAKYLTNSEELLALLVDRMESDWTSLAPKMRRAWGAKEIDSSLNKL